MQYETAPSQTNGLDCSTAAIIPAQAGTQPPDPRLRGDDGSTCAARHTVHTSGGSSLSAPPWTAHSAHAAPRKPTQTSGSTPFGNSPCVIVRWVAMKPPQRDGQPPDHMSRAGLSGSIHAIRSNPVASGCTATARTNTTRNTG